MASVASVCVVRGTEVQFELVSLPQTPAYRIECPAFTNVIWSINPPWLSETVPYGLDVLVSEAFPTA